MTVGSKPSLQTGVTAFCFWSPDTRNRLAAAYSQIMSPKTPAPEKRRFETLTAALVALTVPLVALTALLQAVSKFIEVVQHLGH